MQQRSGERDEIPDDGALAERVDLDGAKPLPGSPQGRNNSEEVGTGSDQHGNRAVRMLGPGLPDDLQNPLRF